MVTNSVHLSPSVITSHEITRSPPLYPLDTSSLNTSSYNSRPPSALSASVDDILIPGDVVGPGLSLHDEMVYPLPLSASHHNGGEELNSSPIKFEVVRTLGTGSTAIVYQVRQILSGCPPATGELSQISLVNSGDIPSSPAPAKYGREYALKCLSKAGLDEDALRAQMFEACNLFFRFLYLNQPHLFFFTPRPRFTSLCLPIQTL